LSSQTKRRHSTTEKPVIELHNNLPSTTRPIVQSSFIKNILSFIYFCRHPTIRLNIFNSPASTGSEKRSIKVIILLMFFADV
jgi:hypothetical protein